MAFDNTNKGILSKNKKKTLPTHPPYSGTINVEGVEYWVSAWVNEGREGTAFAGEKYFKLTLKKKEKQPAQTRSSAPADTEKKPFPTEVDEEVPF